MSDDLTRKLPGDEEPIAPQDDDKIGLLVVGVQSLSVNLESLSTAVQEMKARLEALAETVTKRSLETRPIWERALAEIAATRAELGETRAELGETRAELKSEIASVRAELSQTRADLRVEMRDGFRKLGLKIELLNEDSLTLRADQRQLERRVEALESKSP